MSCIFSFQNLFQSLTRRRRNSVVPEVTCLEPPEIPQKAEQHSETADGLLYDDDEDFEQQRDVNGDWDNNPELDEMKVNNNDINVIHNHHPNGPPNPCGEKCWICSFCGTLNNLLESQATDWRCCNCEADTFQPNNTLTIYSWEWDSIHSHKHSNNNLEDVMTTESNQYLNLSSYRICLLFHGFMHESMDELPNDVTYLCLKFLCYYDAFDKNSFSLNYVQSTNFGIRLRRSHESFNSWKNVFGLHTCQYPGSYLWTFHISNVRKLCYPPQITIGVVEHKGSKYNMASCFSFYDDGYGFSSDGECCFGRDDIVTLSLVWSKKDRCKLTLTVNDVKRSTFSIPSDHKYKLAIALRKPGDSIQWIEFQYKHPNN